MYLAFDHPFKVYYKVRQLILLQSAMVCYNKVRQVLQSATEQPIKRIRATACSFVPRVSNH